MWNRNFLLPLIIGAIWSADREYSIWMPCIKENIRLICKTGQIESHRYVCICTIECVSAQTPAAIQFYLCFYYKVLGAEREGKDCEA